MRRFWLVLFVLLSLIPAHAPRAADFPSKPLRLLVGYAAGGSADSIGRAIARELEAVLGQPVVVENRVGAAGTIALDALTHSAPDGYTLGLLSNSTTTALHYVPKPLAMDERFIPLAQFVATRLILIVNPQVVDVNTLGEFVEFARGHPGLSYTSSGHGSPGHLGMELFARQKGLQLTHIPYRGSAPAMQDVIAGRVGVKVVDASIAAPFIQDGRVRPLVSVSTERAPMFPDLPSARELGESAFRIDSTMSLIVPPGTPGAVVQRLRGALKQATDSPGFAEHARRAGNAVSWRDAADYKVWLQRDFDLWGQVIQDAHITTGFN